MRGSAAAKEQVTEGTVLTWHMADALRTTEVPVRKMQPADNRQPGNPAPGPTVYAKQDSLAYTGSVAEQVTSAAAAMPQC